MSAARPRLILLSGPPGVGKSTLADGLARTLRMPVLDKDCIDEPFSPNNRGPSYSAQIEPKVLRALLDLAARNLRNGLDVIVDVPWTHILLNSPEWIAAINACVADAGAHLCVLECVLPAEQLRTRIAGRGLARDQGKLTDPGWAEFVRHDRIGATNPLPHVVIDMAQSPEACARVALAQLPRSDKDR